MEEGTEKEVSATTGFITGQLMMFISIYYAPLHLALDKSIRARGVLGSEVKAILEALKEAWSRRKCIFIETNSTELKNAINDIIEAPWTFEESDQGDSN